jgi:hypothetical protein
VELADGDEDEELPPRGRSIARLLVGVPLLALALAAMLALMLVGLGLLV